ncbi:MAG TPA: hypothetical protein EYG57_14145 [Planctomycetes bacterium]|nr:hypothetical protein [Planctomycetota bacterium]
MILGKFLFVGPVLGAALETGFQPDQSFNLADLFAELFLPILDSVLSIFAQQQLQDAFKITFHPFLVGERFGVLLSLE